ncbi:uncharacterized protein LOC104906118 isoform X2 [Beta vulgaris subsp. vulgaris]|uniref:uncharacterized protein LOC104906118 isoform X2 n=1 Tax=Beta vulgaris subsp. vulgaris TaxID=3555 RepID=UPI002036780E|nr:uncharacterized protein LOC104906118 isoform X2 [Beta vulgaris subsp. vulgaris]
MSTERHMSSVLAKLMGIDKPSTPHATHRRDRGLSENYLQNIALVAKREKVLTHSNDNQINMDVSQHVVECLQVASVIEPQNLVCGTGKPFLSGRSFLPSTSSSGDRIQKKSVSEHINRKHIQERRANSSRINIKSAIQGTLSSQEIAKQIAGQVKNSVWHSCAELSRSEESFKTAMEVKVSSPVCLSDLEQKHDASSFNPVKGSTSRRSRNSTKQLSERWRTGKYSEEIRTSCGNKMEDEVLNTSDGNLTTSFYTANAYEWPVLAARHLSKPALFPFAWVPRRKARDFNFDKNWCVRPGKRDIKQCHATESEEDDLGHKGVQSTSESSICSLVSENARNIHQAASSILNDSVKLAEEALALTGSLTDMLASSDITSPTSHHTHIILNDTGERHLKEDVSENSSVDSLSLCCNFALNLETGEGPDEQNKRMNMSKNFRWENLSAKSTACVLLGDRESWKHQVKNRSNVSEPGSPVSSLEGPEACRHVPNEEHLSVSVSLENDAHGLQRKLQLIETMSLESGSEGPEMVVSSDDGDDGASVGCYHKDPQIMEIYQTLIQESMDFSYVVDVIVESGLQMRNLEMESKTWLLQGYALDPLVFDSLEKKYGKHMPWEKSERRLLFDRLNSGLLQIVKPFVGLNSWRKPIAKRFSSRHKSQEVIEEELWSLLVNQQKELSTGSLDKVRGWEMEWLDLEEDTDLIVQEIQSLLIDEIIEEFVFMEVWFFG